MLDKMSTPAFEAGREAFDNNENNLNNPFNDEESYLQFLQWREGYKFQKQLRQDQDQDMS